MLLVSPAALRDGPWRAFLEREQLGVKNLSYEELAEDRQLNPEADGTTSSFDKDEYAMVVIDEAQAYRNPDTIRAACCARLLEGSPPKDLVLLTATPVNNSLWDLYYLLSYFIRNDAAFAHAGIRSLKQHFAEAMALDPDDLSPDKLFDVLDEVAVRRTRHFVKRYYPNETVRWAARSIPIRFPHAHGAPGHLRPRGGAARVLRPLRPRPRLRRRRGELHPRGRARRCAGTDPRPLRARRAT